MKGIGVRVNHSGARAILAKSERNLKVFVEHHISSLT